MFGILESLTKAVVGVVIEAPVSLAADALTLGGTVVDREGPFTSSVVRGVVQNIKNATAPGGK